MIGRVDIALVTELANDPSEYVRAWSVQLAIEGLPPEQVAPIIKQLAQRDSSLLVRRYLASAIQRLPAEVGWNIAETLAAQNNIADDRELTLLLWYGIAQRMLDNLPRALKLADTTSVPALQAYIQWYAAKSSDAGRESITDRLIAAKDTERLRYLRLLEYAVRGRRDLMPPTGWNAISAELYDSSDGRVSQLAESIGAALGDAPLYARMRLRLASESTDLSSKQHALSILAGDVSPENLPLFVRLLETPELRKQVLPLLPRFNDLSVATELLTRFSSWQPVERDVAIEVLTSRVAWASSLLDAIKGGIVDKNQLTAYHARQIHLLGDEQLSERLGNEWGHIAQSSDDRKVEIAKLVDAYQSAPLWAYNGDAGAAHYKKLCAVCHEGNAQNQFVAPKLAGSGSKGIAYIVENILDPNAVIGRDFQARVVLTSDGQVVTGLVEAETDSSITIRTLNSSVTIAKNGIEETRISENSFMPEGILNSSNNREKIELLKYLMSL